MSILLAAMTVLAALSYSAAWWVAVRDQRLFAAKSGSDAPPEVSQAVSSRPMGTALMVAGMVLHGLAIAATVRQPTWFGAAEPAIRFGFALALSAVLWLGVLILCVEGLSMRLDALRVLVLPIAGLVSVLPLFFPGADHSALSTRPMFMPHLFIGTLAIGVLVMAAMHALLMMVAERILHGKVDTAGTVLARWFEQMPPLMALERILFRFIFVGFLLLTITVGSGVLFSEEVFGRALRLDHKSVFSIAAWVLFGLLLVGRHQWGWRGRTAWRMTLTGVSALLLGYVGSRFVLEVILQRY